MHEFKFLLGLVKPYILSGLLLTPFHRRNSLKRFFSPKLAREAHSQQTPAVLLKVTLSSYAVQKPPPQSAGNGPEAAMQTSHGGTATLHAAKRWQLLPLKTIRTKQLNSVSNILGPEQSWPMSCSTAYQPRKRGHKPVRDCLPQSRAIWGSHQPSCCAHVHWQQQKFSLDHRVMHCRA